MWDCWSKQYCSVQEHTQGSFTTALSPKPQQPLFSTPNISNKVSTVLHFSAPGKHLARFLNLQSGLLLLLKTLSCSLLSYLVCFTHDSGGKEISENHPHTCALASTQQLDSTLRTSVSLESGCLRNCSSKVKTQLTRLIKFLFTLLS